jgi:ribosomal protein S18 acetylase RimI-like enzyme
MKDEQTRSSTMIDDDAPTAVPDTLETDSIVVRTLRADDLDVVVAIDAAAVDRRRPHYFERLLGHALQDSDLHLSLVAELDERVVGFVVATVFYGEFGVLEPSATLDAIGVDPATRRRRVGNALLRQLRLNLGALRVTRIRTEVAWDDFDLLAFFRRQGFGPAARLCLERSIDPTQPEG